MLTHLLKHWQWAPLLDLPVHRRTETSAIAASLSSSTVVEKCVSWACRTITALLDAPAPILAPTTLGNVAAFELAAELVWSTLQNHMLAVCFGYRLFGSATISFSYFFFFSFCNRGILAITGYISIQKLMHTKYRKWIMISFPYPQIHRCITQTPHPYTKPEIHPNTTLGKK